LLSYKYNLTPQSRVLLEKLIVAQLLTIPPLIPNPIHLKLVHTFPHISRRSIQILSSHLRLGLPNGLFPSGFSATILYAFPMLTQTCYMPRPSHHP